MEVVDTIDSDGLGGRSLDNEVEVEIPPLGCAGIVETLVLDGPAVGGNEGVEDDEAVAVCTGDSSGCRVVVVLL
jgi:hypothetical protein